MSIMSVINENKAESSDLEITYSFGSGLSFYSLNICVGVQDKPAVIDGARIYGFSMLNKFNGYEES